MLKNKENYEENKMTLEDIKNIELKNEMYYMMLFISIVCSFQPIIILLLHVLFNFNILQSVVWGIVIGMSSLFIIIKDEIVKEFDNIKNGDDNFSE